jgi:hypothetical protein
MLATAVIAVACGTSNSPQPTPLASAPGSAPASGPTGSGGGGPLATPWTGNAALGIEAMGVADGEIRKGMNDFSAGVQAEDPELMLRAARGLSEVDVLAHNADRVEPYPPMSAFAREYRSVVTDMAAAARELRTAIESGDGAATGTASSKLVETFTRYAGVQAQLADWVVQVPEQKRILVR